MLQKRKGMQSDEERQINCIDRCCSSNYYAILVLELEKPTTPSLEAFWDLRQNFFACFLSFFWLGSLWMALNTLWEKVEKISSEIIWWNLFLLLERQEFSLENFMPSKIPV